MWLGSLERVQLSARGRWNCQTKTGFEARRSAQKTRLDIRVLPRRLRAHFSQRLSPGVLAWALSSALYSRLPS